MVSEFFIFWNLFSNHLGEWNKSEIWEIRELLVLLLSLILFAEESIYWYIHISKIVFKWQATIQEVISVNIVKFTPHFYPLMIVFTFMLERAPTASPLVLPLIRPK